MKVLIIALTTSRRNAVLDDCAFLREQGAEVQLLTLKADDWPELDAEVPVLELGAAEKVHPLPRVERLLVFRLPGAFFKVLLRAAAVLASVPGGSAPARALAGAARTAEAGWTKVANAWHRRGFMRFYRVLRPWVLWRAARRSVLSPAVLDGFDRVVVADAQGIPVGWHLARRDEALPVTLGLDRTSVAVARRESAEPGSKQIRAGTTAAGLTN